MNGNILYLLELLKLLRSLRKAELQSLCLDADGLASGYHQLRTHAPRRTRPYLSSRRGGTTSSGESSTRTEEHLAIGLFNMKELALPNGERLRLLDYQFPLKSKNADEGIGKIDLVGLCDDGTLAVVELKTGSNAEDRRIALLEGLIYAAIVEANIEQIAEQILAERCRHVAGTQPKIIVVAPFAYWSNPEAYPAPEDLQRLTAAVTRAIPVEIALMELSDANLIEFGLNGRPPLVHGNAYLSTVRWR